MTPVKKSWFWVPVQLTIAGHARVEAYTPEDALEMVENVDFNSDEVIHEQVLACDVTGAPMTQEVS